jgi:hypothetical protein
VEAVLGQLAPFWIPHTGQREFLESPAKIRVLACGRRWGKTDACAAQTIIGLSQSHPTKHLIIAPTLEQSRLLFLRVLWFVERLAERGVEWARSFKCRHTPYPSLRVGEHQVSARSGHIGRSLRGDEATNIVVDEAAYLPEEVVTEVAMPMLATTDGCLSMISTPNGLNHFWRFYQMGTRGEHGVWSRSGPSSESPHVSSSFLEVQRQLISDRAYRVEYECEFLESSSTVFSTEAVQQCLTTRLPVWEDAVVCAGVDWARYEDYTAVAVLSGSRDGASLVELRRISRMSWSGQVEAIAEILNKYSGVRVLCDATGVGDPIVEMLRSRLPNASVDPAVFTWSFKADLIDNLAWLFENRSLRIQPDPELLRELQHYEARQRPSGKSSLGARQGFHDDLVTALALAARLLPKPYRPSIAIGEQRRFAAPRATQNLRRFR